MNRPGPAKRRFAPATILGAVAAVVIALFVAWKISTRARTVTPPASQPALTAAGSADAFGHVWVLGPCPEQFRFAEALARFRHDELPDHRRGEMFVVSTRGMADCVRKGESFNLPDCVQYFGNPDRFDNYPNGTRRLVYFYNQDTNADCAVHITLSPAGIVTHIGAGKRYAEQ